MENLELIAYYFNCLFDLKISSKRVYARPQDIIGKSCWDVGFVKTQLWYRFKIEQLTKLNRKNT